MSGVSKVTKVQSITGHKIDYNGVLKGTERPVGVPSKN